MLTEGNEIPMKKPRTAPIIVTITSLMLSFGNLRTLQASTCQNESVGKNSRQGVHG